MRERRLLAAGGGLMSGFAGMLARLLGSSGNPKLCQLFPLRRAIFRWRVSLLLSPGRTGAPGPGQLPALPLPISACLKTGFAFATSSLVRSVTQGIFAVAYNLFARTYPDVRGKKRGLLLC